jgi:hypothetical protein
MPGAAQSCISPAEYEAALDEARAALPRDRSWLERSSLEKLIFGEVTETYGLAMTRLFDTWPPPSALALALFLAERFGVTADMAAFPALVNAAILADVESPQAYHNNDHFKKVLLQAARQIATHNHICAAGARFSPHDAMIMMIAACIHDLGHDGAGNAPGGAHVPYRLERQSFAAARPYLAAAGLGGDDLLNIQAIVLSTDVSPFGSGESPARLLRLCYLRHEGAEGGMPDMPPELARFAHDPHLTRMAMVMAASDIASSSGLSFSEGLRQSRQLARETGVIAFRSVEALLAFVEGDIGRAVLMTQAGAKIYGPGHEAIRAECARRIASGDMFGTKANSDKAGRNAA